MNPMDYIEQLKSQQGGFSFTLADRPLDTASHKFTKTGTTIVGVRCKEGVVLGADTRATSGPIVEDKNCEKIDHLAPNIYCAGAGTAADTFYVKRNKHKINYIDNGGERAACYVLLNKK